MRSDNWDVIVVGGGNAGLCAALSAREHCDDVLLIEKAPESKRGGNSIFTGGRMRIPHGDIHDVSSVLGVDVSELDAVDLDEYSEQRFFEDLVQTSRQRCDLELAETLAADARPGLEWLKSLGARFELPIGRDEVRVDGRERFMGGDDFRHIEGGPGLVGNLLKQSFDRSIDVAYDCAAIALVREDGGVEGVVVRTPEGLRRLRARAVVLACGGFEANAQMRAQWLGPGWDLAMVRGTEYNTGDGIRLALDIGARPYGHWSSCHSVAWDYMAPEIGRSGEYQRSSFRMGITVDRYGRRFFDEGADLRAYSYATIGSKIVQHADGYAVQIFDQKVEHLLRSNYRMRDTTKVVTDDIDVIADEFELDRQGLRDTIATFNAAAPDVEIDYTRKDGAATVGLDPPKSNWGARIDTPPYHAFVVGAGITFTFGGLRINRDGEVLDHGNSVVGGLYAAGEIVGGIFYHNYPGGSGLTSGMVFGRRAGSAAGKQAGAALSGPAYAR